MSLSSVRSETALRSRLFSSSRSFRRFTCSVFSPPNSGRHREYVTSLTPIWRIASAMGCPCETRTSTCRSFATISSGLYRFLAITVLLDVKDIPQVGPLQWGRIMSIKRNLKLVCGTSDCRAIAIYEYTSARLIFSEREVLMLLRDFLIRYIFCPLDNKIEGGPWPSPPGGGHPGRRRPPPPAARA